MAQSAQRVLRRQKELQSIRDQIREMESRIKEQQKKEKVSLDLLDTYDRESGPGAKPDLRLRTEEADLQHRIDASRSTITQLERQYGFLKDPVRELRDFHIQGRPVHDTELLLSSNSLNQLSIRNDT